jgi:hypothetical protein
MIEFLNIFGEVETLVSEHLYPYRYVITPLIALAGISALIVAVRMGLHEVLLRHRALSVAIGVPLVIVTLVAGNYFLSPLWERSFLDEASPLEAAGQPGTVAQPGSGVQPPATTGSQPGNSASIALRGSFKGADDFHFGRGDAQIISTGGKNVLRFENFSVRNGPDLFVYLSRDVDGKRVDEALNLGKLKATDGAFNYDIPAGIDVSNVRSVVVWCKQFSVLFAIATF